MKQNYKSPFFIIENFISPLLCEDIIQRLNHTYPDTDKKENPLKTIKYNNLSEIRLLPYIEDVMPKLEQYFGFNMKGILPFLFEWMIEGYIVQPPKCISYQRLDTKWVKVNDISFTGVIFLNDYNKNSNFDDEFEVYGGKLEFINHNFSINPSRGTLVFFPECPNFLNTNSSISAGELTQIRFNVVAEEPYNYNIDNFPGNYKTWFKS